MIRIAITAEAYEAIARTLALGSVGYEIERSESGKVFVWIERQAMDRLTAERRRGEDFSDTIIRLAAVGMNRRQEGIGATVNHGSAPRRLGSDEWGAA
jgi:hypothetical protein